MGEAGVCCKIFFAPSAAWVKVFIKYEITETHNPLSHSAGKKNSQVNEVLLLIVICRTSFGNSTVVCASSTSDQTVPIVA